MARHDRALEAIFAEPTRANVKWAAIEALFLHLGAAIGEGAGSRIHVELNGVANVFHKPHPGPHAKKPLVREVRNFLRRTGYAP
jgi:hypothetical protein